MITLDADSRLAVGHLIVRQENEDEYVVGDPATGTFVVVPELGARLVELFAAGRSVAEAATALEQETGEPIDALDFAEVLVEAGIISDRTEVAKAKVWSVSRVPAWVVKPLFGKVAWTFYAGCLLSTLWMFVAEPSLRPTYEDTFVFPDIAASLLLTNIVVVLLTILHEIWHAFAGAAVGVPSQLRLERRGVFPVLETDLSGLWALPPAKRYGPFLAGMGIDSVILFAAVAPRYAWSHGWIELPPGLIRILAMVVLSQVAKLAFQTLAYLRTDMYLVMATATGCNNLHQVTRLSLKRLIRKLRPEEATILRDANPRDLRVARWYRLLYLAGLIWMVFFAWEFVLPSAKVALGWSLGILFGAPIASFYWWEGLLLISFTLLDVTLPLFVVVRNRLRARRAVA
ncbi:PqqD family protein [Kribbella monticola]|uniref:PqqD family protein n=1 Tax=Kribbella monticola TaxID=2185285 RepID=UPI000DD3FFF2|nr:PqqD family protein [Kribbella monticola]